MVDATKTSPVKASPLVGQVGMDMSSSSGVHVNSQQTKKPWVTPMISSQATFERMALTCTGASGNPICDNVQPAGRRFIRPKGSSAAECITLGACSNNPAGQS
jgi:hypothetical protein